MIGRLMPVILIVLAIAIFVGYVNPTYTKGVLPVQAKIKQYDSTLKAAQEFNQKEAQLANDRNIIPDESIQRLQAFLPDGVDNVQFILDLNALAARSGVQLSDFDVKSSAAVATDQSSGALEMGGAGASEHLDISLKVSGTYAAFRTFLNGLEHSLRPMDVIQLTVSSSPTGVYSYGLTLRIYWLR